MSVKQLKQVVQKKDKDRQQYQKIINLVPIQEKCCKEFDPAIAGQVCCLVSFLIPKEFLGEKHKMLGAFKIRGVFNDEGPAERYAKQLITTHENAYEIFISKMGSWMPISNYEGHVASYEEVVMEDVVQSNDMANMFVEEDKKKQEEQIDKIVDKRSKVQKKADKEPNKDSVERFIQLFSTKFQLKQYLDYIKKTHDTQIIKYKAVQEEYKALAEKHPEYIKKNAKKLKEIEENYRQMEIK